MKIIRCFHPCVAHQFRQYPQRLPCLLVSAIGHHFILFRDISFTIILCYVPRWVLDTLQHGDHCSFQYVWWSSRPSYIWASVGLPKDLPEVTELSIACGVCAADRSALLFCVCVFLVARCTIFDPIHVERPPEPYHLGAGNVVLEQCLLLNWTPSDSRRA